MKHQLIMENWRGFISEAEATALGTEEKKGKELVKKAQTNLQKLSPKEKEALEQLRKLLPAVALSALDAEADETDETNEARRGGRKGRLRRVRRLAALKAMGLPKETKKNDLSPEQRRAYDEQIKQWNARSQQIDYMTTGAGGQTNLLFTQLDELPLVKKIPGISAALMTLFGTTDLTVVSALEALTSITGPFAG